MDVNPRTRRTLRLQRYLTTLLLLAAVGLAAWLSNQYVIQADWTANARNSLSQESARLLARLEGSVIITAFARENETLRAQIRDLVDRYRREKPDIELHFVNPDAEPERVRELGITHDGELRVAYQGRSERVQELSEQALTNALMRVARQGERWIAFLSGHGERDPQGQANHDLGEFGRTLEGQGLKVQTLNLAQTPEIPHNVGVLVIAGPQVALLPGEARRIRHYVEQGGNLLWLAEPGDSHGLDNLADLLGIQFLPGVIVDPTTRLFGIQNPDFVLVPEYPAHAITRDLDVLTLFPHAAALESERGDIWQAESFLTTLPRTWTETGPLDAPELRYDPDTDERPGPLDLGLAFTRSLDAEGTDEGSPRSQRVVVVGDGDFLSNAFLGNGGNLDLGLNIVHWLAGEDAFISIRARSAPDQTLELGRTAQGVIGIGFLFVLPALLLVTGLAIWLRRRKR
ncbi:GldG family protein [Thiohalobacter sp.]|uniref:GldG family protein n=1 Tax=Thiohalobacter sp. TaxID=2025948 RepID=UPI00260E2975|nr:GldG family protein [Thiohalobacter sp.]